MLYPDKLIKVDGGQELYIPDPQQVQRVYENLHAQDPETPFPFWAKIWPSARAMVSFLEKEPHWTVGKNVLELGAGIGLPSFTIAPHASFTVISDHAPEAVALIEKNIQYLNLQNAKAILFDWNHFPAEMEADIVLLSDINYAPSQFEPLLLLIRKFLEDGASIILSTPQRITITPFASALQPYIKRSFLQTTQDRGQDIDIRILILSL